MLVTLGIIILVVELVQLSWAIQVWPIDMFDRLINMMNSLFKCLVLSSNFVSRFSWKQRRAAVLEIDRLLGVASVLPRCAVDLSFSQILNMSDFVTQYEHNNVIYTLYAEPRPVSQMQYEHESDSDATHDLPEEILERVEEMNAGVSYCGCGIPCEKNQIVLVCCQGCWENMNLYEQMMAVQSLQPPSHAASSASALPEAPRFVGGAEAPRFVGGAQRPRLRRTSTKRAFDLDAAVVAFVDGKGMGKDKGKDDKKPTNRNKDGKPVKVTRNKERAPTNRNKAVKGNGKHHWCCGFGLVLGHLAVELG